MLFFAWGATVPMMAHAAGIELDETTTTWDEWVTTTERNTVKASPSQAGWRWVTPLDLPLIAGVGTIR